MNEKRVILIIAPPGDLQIGLQALLTTHLDVDVLVIGEGSLALKVIDIHKPAMVIMDDDLLNDTVPMIIQGVKSSYPDTATLVMVNDEVGRQKMVGKGADLILLKGFPPVKFLSLIEDRLS